MTGNVVLTCSEEVFNYNEFILNLGVFLLVLDFKAYVKNDLNRIKYILNCRKCNSLKLLDLQIITARH
jgi:hypothetical protein